MNNNIAEQDVNNPPAEVSQDSKNMALLCWIGTAFFVFIPGLILYLLKGDDEYVADQAKEALNWSITFILAHFAALALTFLVVGALLFPVIWILNLVFCLMGAVDASKGKVFRVPFTLRLLK